MSTVRNRRRAKLLIVHGGLDVKGVTGVTAGGRSRASGEVSAMRVPARDWLDRPSSGACTVWEARRREGANRYFDARTSLAQQTLLLDSRREHPTASVPLIFPHAHRGRPVA